MLAPRSSFCSGFDGSSTLDAVFHRTVVVEFALEDASSSCCTNRYDLSTSSSSFCSNSASLNCSTPTTRMSSPSNEATLGCASWLRWTSGISRSTCRSSCFSSLSSCLRRLSASSEGVESKVAPYRKKRASLSCPTSLKRLRILSTSETLGELIAT